MKVWVTMVDLQVPVHRIELHFTSLHCISLHCTAAQWAFVFCIGWSIFHPPVLQRIIMKITAAFLCSGEQLTFIANIHCITICNAIQCKQSLLDIGSHCRYSRVVIGSHQGIAFDLSFLSQWSENNIINIIAVLNTFSFFFCLPSKEGGH